MKLYPIEQDDFDIKHPIDIHAETAINTVTGILERLTPYEISNAETDNLIKILKMKYPSLIFAAISVAALAGPLIIGGLVSTIRDLDASASPFALFVSLFFVVIFALIALIVYRAVRKNNAARDYMISSINRGRIRGFEFTVDGKQSRSQTDSSFSDYYIKVGENIFEISGREYQTLYKDEKSIALIIDGKDNTEFRFYGAESLQTGRVNRKHEE